MPSTKRVFVLLFLLAAPLLPAQAAEQSANALPAGITTVVSVNSVMEFFDAVDSFAAAALEKTPQSFQPGVLPYMAIAFSPVSLLDVDLDNAAHLIVLADKGEPVRLAMVATVPDFEAFVASASEGGKSEADGDIYRIDTPHDYQIFAVGLGDGMALMAEEREDLDLIRDVLSSWRPEADPGAVLTMTFAGLDGLFFGADFARILDDALSGGPKYGDHVAALAAIHGHSEAMVRALGKVWEKALASLKAEMAKITGGKLHLRLDEEVVGVTVALHSPPDSLVGRVAAASAGWENRINDSARFVASDAETYIQSAQSLDNPPGIDLLPKLVAELANELPGESAKQLPEAYGALAAAGLGESASRMISQTSNIVYIRTESPAAAAEALAGLYTVFGDVLTDFLYNESGAEPALAITEDSIDGLAYRWARLSNDAEMRLVRFAGKLGQNEVQLSTQALNLLFAPVDGYLLLATGSATPGDLADAAASIKNPPESAFVDLPQARRLIDLMDCRQLGFGLAKASLLARLILEGLMTDPTIPPEGHRLLAGVIPDLIAEGGMTGFGHGIRDGKYALEWVATSACVNEMVRNYFLVAEREDVLYGTGE